MPNSRFKDARRFDIDLADPFLQEKLEHIVKLSGCFVSPGSPIRFAKDFMFIITKDDIDVPIYEYDKMVGAFDRHRFYTPGEILSIGVGSQAYKPVKMTAFEDNLQIDRQFVERWESSKRLLVISTENAFSNDFNIPWWET